MARGRPVLVGAVLAVLAVAACGSPSAGPSDGRITVVTSTDVWGSVAQAVGGNDVDVTAIIHKPTQDPHDYQSSPLDAATIARAQLVVYNGNGYDDFFPTDLKATPSDGRRAIVAFDLSGKPASDNEHIFYDLPTVRKVADAIAKSLGALRPAHAAAFTANAQRFDRKLADLATTARTLAAAHARVVVTEPVADYLLAAAGIQDATPPAFERAVESDTDIPVSALSAMTNLITAKQVSALINNAQTETALTDQLIDKAHQAGLPVIDVTETLPAGTTDYVRWMTNQLDALTSAIDH